MNISASDYQLFRAVCSSSSSSSSASLEVLVVSVIVKVRCNGASMGRAVHDIDAKLQRLVFHIRSRIRNWFRRTTPSLLHIIVAVVAGDDILRMLPVERYSTYLLRAEKNRLFCIPAKQNGS